jgi:hypothetical protein
LHYYIYHSETIEHNKKLISHLVYRYESECSSDHSSYCDSLVDEEEDCGKEEIEASTKHILFSDEYVTENRQNELPQMGGNEDDIYQDIDDIENAIKRLEVSSFPFVLALTHFLIVPLYFLPGSYCGSSGRRGRGRGRG